MNEWVDYKVGDTPGERSCLEFTSAFHTSHVGTAVNIIETGEIRPTLVFDKSKLNDKRILVAWLSPNDWGIGYRYGNVRFQIDFHELFRDKYFYWVEVGDYKIKAPRILVTDQERDNIGLLPYDPFDRLGPWWYDKDENKHYFNQYHCLEFMFEAPISLKSVTRVDFVEHHREYCSIFRTSPQICKELGLSANRGGALFLTRIATLGISLTKYSDSFISNGMPDSFSVESPFYELIGSITRQVEFTGTLIHSTDEGKAVARSILSSYTYFRRNEAKTLANLFVSIDELIKAVSEILCQCIGFDDWQAFSDKIIAEFTD